MFALEKQFPILTEGSVFELLRRGGEVAFDPAIAHGALIYDDESRRKLAAIHGSYLAIGRAHSLPMIAWADTWRASGARIARTRFAGRDVNGDNVRFLREVIRLSGAEAAAGALTGPMGDGYDPREAPGFDDALRYHAAQVGALAAASPDLIVAATLPAFEEARAIARLVAETGIPYMLSVVVGPDGAMLDGTPLESAIPRIDAETPRAPLGFSINCAHSSAARRAIALLTPAVASRVIALQANASALPPEALDGLDRIDAEEPEVFGAALAEIAKTTSVRILGGCCGTDPRHIEALAARLVRAG